MMMKILFAALIGVACANSVAIPDDSSSQLSACLGETRVSPASAILHSGDTLQARANVPSCSAIYSPTFRWRSSDTTVAVVDSLTGLILARSAGLTSIIASRLRDPTQAGSLTLKVAGPP